MSSSQSTRVSGRPSKGIKAQWFDSNTKVLLDALIEEIHAGNQVNGQYTSEGWRNICEKFSARSSLPYTKSQLKNRSSRLKALYTKWKKLTDRATGLGIDPATGTIAADDRWWNAQAQEDPEILKWKSCPPRFIDLMAQCYAGTVATCYAAYIPHYLSMQIPQGSVSTSHYVEVPAAEIPQPRPSCLPPQTYRPQPKPEWPHPQPELHHPQSFPSQHQPQSYHPQHGPSQPQPQSYHLKPQTSQLQSQPQPQGQGSNIHTPTASSGVGSHPLSRKRCRASMSRNNESDSLDDSIQQIDKVLKDKVEMMKTIGSGVDPDVRDLEKAYELLGKIDGLNEGDDVYIHCMNVLLHKLKRWTFLNVVSKWSVGGQLNWFMRQKG